MSVAKVVTPTIDVPLSKLSDKELKAELARRDKAAKAEAKRIASLPETKAKKKAEKRKELERAAAAKKAKVALEKKLDRVSKHIDKNLFIRTSVNHGATDGNSLSLSLYCDLTINLDILTDLSIMFGTKEISVEAEKVYGNYGDDDSFELKLWITGITVWPVKDE